MLIGCHRNVNKKLIYHLWRMRTGCGPVGYLRIALGCGT